MQIVITSYSIHYTKLYDLTQKHFKTLDALLNLEQERKDLIINLKYFNDNLKEQQILAINEVKKLFDPINYESIKDDNEDFIAFIKQRTGKETVSLEDDCYSIIGSEKLMQLQQAIASKRHSNITNYLMGKSYNFV